MDETPIKYLTVKKLNQDESDFLYLDLQWPEDKEKAKRLISPTHITEIKFNDDN